MRITLIFNDVIMSTKRKYAKSMNTKFRPEIYVSMFLRNKQIYISIFSDNPIMGMKFALYKKREKEFQKYVNKIKIDKKKAKNKK